MGLRMYASILHTTRKLQPTTSACLHPGELNTLCRLFAGKLGELFGSDLPAFVDLALDHRALVEGFCVAHFSEHFHALDYPTNRDAGRKKGNAKLLRQATSGDICNGACDVAPHVPSWKMRVQYTFNLASTNPCY